MSDADLQSLARRLATERGATLGPPADGQQLARMERVLGPMPQPVRALLSLCSGIEDCSVETGLWLTEAEVDFADTFARCVRLGGDTDGNFWVVDVGPEGDWGPVFFACHDPPVFALQAASLADFLEQLLEAAHPLERIDSAIPEIWRDREPGLTVAEALASGDPALQALAEAHPEARLVDCRTLQVGLGFHADALLLGRQGLVFAIELPIQRSWWRRLLGR